MKAETDGSERMGVSRRQEWFRNGVRGLRGRLVLLHVLVAVRAWALPANLPGETFRIKLTAKEECGVAGLRHITCGVPLLPGQASDPLRIRILEEDAKGEPVALPAQFRVLARWWRGDNSIRWVLVDFATPMRGGEEKLFYLSDAPLDPPQTALRVEQDGATITVTTGPARFVIARNQFTFIQKAILDANGDGRFTDDEDLLATTPDCGTAVEDTYGVKYPGSAGTRSVEVVERGPVRVCIRARGQHLAAPGCGYSRGMYGYDVFLHFYAGSAEVYADVILANNPARSIGSPTFEDASLVLRCADGVESVTLWGDKPYRSGLARGESLCLYQDSNGADTWESCQGYDADDQDDGWNFPKGITASFRGYRILKRERAAGSASESRESVVGSGDHARGLLEVVTPRGRVIIHTRHFWQQFPKAVEASADGSLRLGLFPREYRVPHFLEDTTAKGHEIVLHFGTRSRSPEPVTGGTATPEAEAFAACWDARVYLRPEMAHMAATGALADLGPFTPPMAGLTQRPDSRTCAEGPRMLTEDDLYGNSYGWQVFGERWRSQGGSGRQGARQPMNEDDYLRRWYLTGVREWLTAGDARSRHFRDVRGYRIDDQNPFGFTNWLEFRAANMSENRLDRPQPTDEEYKKYTRGMWKRCGFWLPNPEHNVLDLLYDRYLLFGDIRSLENMRIVAAHGGYFAAYQPPVVTRDRGWGWRSLDRYWELTGDKDAERLMKEVIRNQAQLIGKEPLISGTPDNPNWWFTTIYSRAVAMSALHTGDPTVLALARSLAVGKEHKAESFSSLFAVLYHLTGESRYRDAVMRKHRDEALSVGGYLYICDHWLLQQPPRPIPKPATSAPAS